MDREKVLTRIQKCLALSKSSNANEAATAMRQAQALMREYQIEDDELLAANVCEDNAKTSSTRRPSVWESSLASVVGTAYGVAAYFVTGQRGLRSAHSTSHSGGWKFVGMGPGPEVARYTFEVLIRQLRRARQEYLRENLPRVSRGNRVKRGDLFARAWVVEVKKKVSKFATTPASDSAIKAYMLTRYPPVGELMTTNRLRNLEKKELSSKDIADVLAGIKAASSVSLNHGVNAEAAHGALGNTRQIEFSGV
jgi:hypothetical protein